MKLGPISGLRTGERVRTAKEVHNIETPYGLPAGTPGTLGCLYRVQDGHEIWAFLSDSPIGPKRMFGVSHMDVERANV